MVHKRRIMCSCNSLMLLKIVHKDFFWAISKHSRYYFYSLQLFMFEFWNKIWYNPPLFQEVASIESTEYQRHLCWYNRTKIMKPRRHRFYIISLIIKFYLYMQFFFHEVVIYQHRLFEKFKRSSPYNNRTLLKIWRELLQEMLRIENRLNLHKCLYSYYGFFKKASYVR